MATYQIKKKMLGGYVVEYTCAQCTERLVSPLNEAGTHQPCPACSRDMLVPGIAEATKIHEMEAVQRQKLDDERKAKETHQEAERKERERQAALKRQAQEVHEKREQAQKE